MSLETTVFTFKISVPFEEWAAVYDSYENIQMNKERGIVCIFKGVKKDEPNSVILIEQGEEGKSIAMFEDPAVKPLIESAAHIHDFSLWLIITFMDSFQTEFLSPKVTRCLSNILLPVHLWIILMDLNW